MNDSCCLVGQRWVTGGGCESAVWWSCADLVVEHAQWHAVQCMCMCMCTCKCMCVRVWCACGVCVGGVRWGMFA
jgi:hypothetical protein